jgi:hypothetical protein
VDHQYATRRFPPLLTPRTYLHMTQTRLLFDFEPGRDEDSADDFSAQGGASLKAGSAASPLDLLLRHRQVKSESVPPAEAEEWDVRLMHLLSGQPHPPAADRSSFRLRAL